jgi:hypothetical protein
MAFGAQFGARELPWGFVCSRWMCKFVTDTPRHLMARHCLSPGLPIRCSDLVHNKHDAITECFVVLHTDEVLLIVTFKILKNWCLYAYTPLLLLL